MYDTSGNHGIPSAGVCVLSVRRCVCASRRSSNTSTGSKRASSHGAITITGPGAPLGNISVFTIVCIHVVPHLEGVHTKTSPGRWTKCSQRRLSATIVLYSRTRENVYPGEQVRSGFAGLGGLGHAVVAALAADSCIRPEAADEDVAPLVAGERVVPSPPVMMSLPSAPLRVVAGPPAIVSAPPPPSISSSWLPPSIVSLPSPPLISSLPASPQSRSFPLAPLIVSLPSPPKIASFCFVPVSVSPVSFPRMTLKPASSSSSTVALHGPGSGMPSSRARPSTTGSWSEDRRGSGSAVASYNGSAADSRSNDASPASRTVSL